MTLGVVLLVTAPANLIAQSPARAAGQALPDRGSRSYAVATPGRHAAAIPGTLTRDGETAITGILFVADRWLLFRADDSNDLIAVPMVITHTDGRSPEWALRSAPRNPRTLASTFVIPTWGRFETTMPDALDRMLSRRSPLDVVAARTTPLARTRGEAQQIVDQVALSPFADSLYAIAGRPRAPIGVLGQRHRAGGDAALYSISADSIALDPYSARSLDDLRSLLAHEVGHRLQRTRPELLDQLWGDVPRIDDRAVYGFGNREEHQAEAFRFAIIFLQTTAASERDRTADAWLLELYELLMPGTRAVATALLEEPVYRRHPLRERARRFAASGFITR